MPTFRFLTVLALGVIAVAATAAAGEGGALPTDRGDRPLNFDFETGDLRDWTVEGEAFAGQPVRGDTVTARGRGMKSQHAGQFWVGGYELKGDAPKGRLRSSPFVLNRPFVRFLVTGGASAATRVEVVRHDTGAVVFRASGDDTESLKPVVADLTPHLGKELFVRLVDDSGGPWGHLNFDDLTLWERRPPGPSRPAAVAADVFAHEGLPPAEAAAAMTVPPGFHVTLFAGEPDVVQPIAAAVDDRGRLWVAEAYSYPVRVPDGQARDRILIFEDADNDGRFDKRTVFADGLNLVSGLEVGFGGVWVGAAPQLLFIPDRDGDDRPDGPPRVVLDGWGAQDTHETLNSFTWGPDGWLYGCHGVFTHSRVGKPGAADRDRTPINAGVWRYHPRRDVFEVFAHGTSNPWGVDFDRHGQAFLTACVIPHLFHVAQGGRYERQAGQHFNPYTYDDIKTIADHRHYVGGNPHAGNGRSDEAGGGHAHAGALIVQGGSWPKEYAGSILMNNIHGARLNRDTLERRGSGFVGHHARDFLLANDRWSQIVSLRGGPDGSVFLIDWYDKNQCHHTNVAGHDRTNGRIFKVSYGAPAPSRLGDDLVASLTHPNAWHARHALRRLYERVPELDDEARVTTRAKLEGLAFGDSAEPQRLYGLWGLHALGALDDEAVVWGLADRDEYHRAWTVQLATERGQPSGERLARFAELARTDPSPVVRLYLASALQRLPLAERWDIAEGLAGHGEDAGDPNLPLMVWYAVEPLAEADPSRALRLARGSRLPNLLPFMTRRVSAAGTPEAIALVVGAVGEAPDDSARRALVEGLNEALRGRRRVDMPAAWPGVFAGLQKSGDANLRAGATALAVTFGDLAALRSLRAALADRALDPARRRDALAALLKARDPALPETLRALLAEPGLRGAALRGLAQYDDPGAAKAVLKAYPDLTPDERRDALNTLAARAESALALLDAVGAGRVAARDLSADLVRQLRNHKDPRIDAAIGKVWGSARETSADRAQAIAHFRALLTSKPGRAPDPELGRALFARTCQQCHTLFGTGGNIGPDLTGSNRADLDYLLSNVLDPSALIGKDYVAQVIATTDGRVLTGLVRGEDGNALTLQTANEVVVIPLGEIDERRASDRSMMPEDLWASLSEHEVRSLVAYLASPRQVPMRATPDNVSGFFNGRDLSGWEGDPALWSVSDGVLVGKAKGLTETAFLRSALSAGDFRLTLRVKLVGDRGHSGILFRGAALPGGGVKGDQAGFGPGRWGTLTEEGGRGPLRDGSGAADVRAGAWNTFEITAAGPTIRVRLNGRPCVELTDPAGAARGVFAFSLPAGAATEVHVKDIRLELIEPPGR